MHKLFTSALAAGVLAFHLGGPAVQAANPCNPCAAKKNPCNPCAGKRNPCNPCGGKNPCNPCGGKNPCNPCGGAAKIDPKSFTRPAGGKSYKSNKAELVKLGKKLWNDKSLGKSGLACQTCHQQNRLFNASFAKPYPHPVKMAVQRAGLNSIELDEMVQFCMLVPMKAKILPWDSKKLAALTAYSAQIQKSYKPSANPCAGKNPCNPCAGKNPCNPCGGKNPCAGKNPCNPCGGKKRNPCNPCGK